MSDGNENTYKDREIDFMLKDIHEKLDLIIVQTTKTNGKVAENTKTISRLQYNLVIVATVVLTLLFVSGSELVNFILKII